MKPSKKQKNARSSDVRRIMIDERLDRTKFRVLVSHLKPSVKEIDLKKISIWLDEKEKIYDCKECLKLLNLDSEKKLNHAVQEISGTEKKGISQEEFCINLLQEGQVFLLGKFRIEGKDRHNPDKIAVKQSGQTEFYRIDSIDSFRKAVSKLYAKCAG